MSNRSIRVGQLQVSVFVSRLVTLLIWISALVCSVCLLLVLTDSFQSYLKYETGNSIKQIELENVPFPAVTICSSYYNIGAAYVELKLPVSLRPPTKLFSDPLQFYLKLGNLNIPIEPNLWRYYFTLDKIIKNTGNLGCNVGGASCEYNLPENINFSNFRNYSELRVDVPAGYWISRFMSASHELENFLCHTLVTNVSIDLGKTNGNSIRMTWKESVVENMPFWEVYIHDRREMVLLQTFAIESLPYLIFQKKSTLINQDSVEELLRLKKKGRIIPKLHTQENTPHNSCNEDDDYSDNLCVVKWCWDQRIKRVRNDYGKSFDCLMPGVIASPENMLPICKLFEDRDLLDNLSSPAIGAHKKGSPCKGRCQYYDYALHEEGVMEYDSFMDQNDLVLYFPSGIVEVWHTFELQNFMKLLSDAGGAIGLFLGFSVFSFLTAFLHFVEYFVSVMMKWFQ